MHKPYATLVPRKLTKASKSFVQLRPLWKALILSSKLLCCKTLSRPDQLAKQLANNLQTTCNQTCYAAILNRYKVPANFQIDWVRRLFTDPLVIPASQFDFKWKSCDETQLTKFVGSFLAF